MPKPAQTSHVQIALLVVFGLILLAINPMLVVLLAVFSFWKRSKRVDFNTPEHLAILAPMTPAQRLDYMMEKRGIKK